MVVSENRGDGAVALWWSQEQHDASPHVLYRGSILRQSSFAEFEYGCPESTSRMATQQAGITAVWRQLSYVSLQVKRSLEELRQTLRDRLFIGCSRC
jgi:hypothetical protein